MTKREITVLVQDFEDLKSPLKEIQSVKGIDVKSLIVLENKLDEVLSSLLSKTTFTSEEVVYFLRLKNVIMVNIKNWR